MRQPFSHIKNTTNYTVSAVTLMDVYCRNSNSPKDISRYIYIYFNPCYTTDSQLSYKATATLSEDAPGSHLKMKKSLVMNNSTDRNSNVLYLLFLSEPASHLGSCVKY